MEVRLHGNINYIQLRQSRPFLPRELYFPGIISLVPGSVGPGPIKEAQDVYFEALRQAGLKPDLPLNTLWDPTMIVFSALRQLGADASARQLRDYVANLHGWVGTNGVYDFRDGSQRGIGVRAIVVDRYDSEQEQFIPVSGRAGYLK